MKKSSLHEKINHAVNQALSDLSSRYSTSKEMILELSGTHSKNVSNDACIQLAKNLQKRNELLFAYDTIKTFQKFLLKTAISNEQHCPNGIRKRLVWLKNNSEYTDSLIPSIQHEGMLLNKLGAPAKAEFIFQCLNDFGNNDDETLGNLAASIKTRALALPKNKRDKRNRLLHQSLSIYLSVYEQDKSSYWTGINAATLSAILNQHATAKKLASEIKKTCLDSLKLNKDDYWAAATVAESCLIEALSNSTNIPDLTKAQTWYEKSCDLAPGYLELRSTQRNAILLANSHTNPQFVITLKKCIKKWLPIPPVLTFTGHMSDVPNRPEARFPEHMETRVSDTLKQLIKETNVNWLFASAAAGADILMHEAMIHANLETNIILPFCEDGFKQESLNPSQLDNDNNPWISRFDAVMKTAQDSIGLKVWQSSPGHIPNQGIYFDYANKVMHGLALMHARQMGSHVEHIAVWDGKSGGVGGTQEALKNWLDHGDSVTVVPPLHPEKHYKICSDDLTLETPSATETATEKLSIRSMVFSDLEGYSKFTESQIDTYYDHFLMLIAEVMEEYGDAIETKNTWGDATYTVFNDLEKAGDFALKVCERVKAKNKNNYWVNLGLPNPMNIRVSVHTGPVMHKFDPILQQKAWTGANVSLAARIEPVVPPGEVYASLGTAALSEVNKTKAFKCDYVGQAPFAKSYGVYPLFHLKRRY